MICRLHFGWLWGSIGSRRAWVEMKRQSASECPTFRVDHTGNPDQMCAGGDIQGVDNRRAMRLAMDPHNQDVNYSSVRCASYGHIVDCCMLKGVIVHAGRHGEAVDAREQSGVQNTTHAASLESPESCSAHLLPPAHIMHVQCLVVTRRTSACRSSPG
jgi:hypothetical protein